MLKSLGYEFSNNKLLELALTHRSMNAVNNERLEFLGDAVLSFVISSRLFNQFPNLQEGDLSRMRANLVNEEVLADIAKQFNLGDVIQLGSGELKSGGYNRKSILADTLEALIGAIYLDSDIQTCGKIILPWFEERLRNIDKIEYLKDAKSRLQEYLQAHKLTLPVYTVLSVSGEAHAQHFHIKCQVETINYQSEGVGSSRRQAEQMAAEDFLRWFLKEKK